MDVLVAFVLALLAGGATALSPCVLPVLPVVLAGGASGGARRPLGVAVGLACSFTVATVLLAYALDAIGLPGNTLRWIAIAALAVFGVALLWPPAAARVEAWLGRVLPRVERRPGGDGFTGGLALGGALGLLYAPCAGPVLAGVITVSAAQDFSLARLALGAGYGIGAGVALLVLMLLGRRALRRVSLASGRLQQVLGGVMVVIAVVMALELDLDFQRGIADELPAGIVTPTKGLEDSDAVDRALGRERSRRETAAPAHGEALPVYGPAPDFAGVTKWFNTQPLSLRQLRGRVVLIDFWTYTCINCLRTFPYLRAWDERYRDAGLTIVGVHTPEFQFEKDSGNVRGALRDNRLRYAVAQDNERGTWDAWQNQYWPAKYLIDAEGQVRYAHFGEGDYDVTERAIRSLLAERGAAAADRSLAAEEIEAETADRAVRTPETYLGWQRADGFPYGPPVPRTGAAGLLPGTRVYERPPARMAPSTFALSGRWEVGEESATARAGNATIEAQFAARRVFLVLSPPRKGSGRVWVSLDGRPVRAGDAGSDVRGGAVRVDRQRLYRLIELPRAGEHRLSLRVSPGTQAFAFTFG